MSMLHAPKKIGFLSADFRVKHADMVYALFNAAGCAPRCHALGSADAM